MQNLAKILDICRGLFYNLDMTNEIQEKRKDVNPMLEEKAEEEKIPQPESLTQTKEPSQEEKVCEDSVKEGCDPSKDNMKEGDATAEDKIEQKPQEGEGKEDKPEGENKEEKPAKEGEEEKKPLPFITYGGEVTIKQSENILYYKTRYRFLSQIFKLVGKFNSAGKYVINDDVKRELLALPKEIISSGAEGYKTQNVFYGKDFMFDIKIHAEQDNMARASLYLEESVGKTLHEEKIITPIAEFVDKDDDEFRIKVRRAFNLVDIASLINDFDFPRICVILQNSLDMDIVVGELFDMASQIYMLRILKLLEGSEKGREIIARYKALLDGSEKEEKRQFSYLRMLLERVIDEFGGFEKLDIPPEEKKKLIDDLLLPINALKKQAESQNSVTEVQKGQGKSESKKGGTPAKAPAKKGGAKKGGAKKGGAKKGGNKKGGKKSAKGGSGGLDLVFYIDDKKENKKEVPSKNNEEGKVVPPPPPKPQPKNLDFQIQMNDSLDAGGGENREFVDPALSNKSGRNEKETLISVHAQTQQEQTFNELNAFEIRQSEIVEVQVEREYAPQEFDIDDFEREL